MHRELKPTTSAQGLRIGLVVSRYHAPITDALRDGAVDCYTRAGGSPDDLVLVNAPGTFEVTALCAALAERGDLDAVVAVGCVISGQTTHDQYLCQAVSHGLTEVTLRTGVPVSFGVLTCQSLEQAEARAGGDRGNKGAEAMAAAIDTARTIRRLRDAPCPRPANAGRHRGGAT